MGYAHPVRDEEGSLAGMMSYTSHLQHDDGLQSQAVHRPTQTLHARLIDLIISGLCLVVLAPAIAAVWVAIRRSAPTPAQVRPVALNRTSTLVSVKADGPLLPAAAVKPAISSSKPIPAQA